jgi:protein ImuA
MNKGLHPMSATGSSDRIRFLRETLAGLEQAGTKAGAGFASPAPLPITSFGREGAPCALDRALGGLFSGALYEAAPARMVDSAAAAGFALALAVRFAATLSAPVIFISDEFSTRETGAPYGLGLAAHGLDPAQLLYVRTIGGHDLLWSLEESLRAGAAACVVTDLGSAARAFDLVAARRITLAARTSGTPCVLIHPPASFNREMAQNGARMRFEIRAARSAEPRGSLRPVPEHAHFAVRFAKAGVTAGQMRGLDTDTFKTIIWDHAYGCFRDKLSLAASAASGAGA